MKHFKKFLEIIDSGHFRKDSDAHEAFSMIIEGSANKDQIKEFLLKINQRKPNIHLLYGAAKALDERSIKLRTPDNTIDVCGTGGDGLNSLNISTAVSFVVAACKVPVAKHGNRSVSSNSGSADIFTELGIDINQSQEMAEESLFENNLAFIFAPLYHPTLKNVAEIRKEIGVKTIFNYLGPLINPAHPKYQLIGCCDKDIAPIMLESSNLLNRKRCVVVCALDGMDEVSISSNSLIFKMDKQIIYPEEIFVPEDYGFKKFAIEEIRGKNPKYNAEKLLDLLKGEKSAYQDIVVLNSALALVIADKFVSLKDAILVAKEAIESGSAYNVLRKLQK